MAKESKAIEMSPLDSNQVREGMVQTPAYKIRISHLSYGVIIAYLQINNHNKWLSAIVETEKRVSW